MAEATTTILKPESLSKVLAVGSAPGAALLMTSNGSLISCAGAAGSDDLTASVVSNAWVSYEKGATEQSGSLQTLFIQCQMGRIAVAQILPGLLLCLWADNDLELSVLEAKLQALKLHIREPLLQVFPRLFREAHRGPLHAVFFQRFFFNQSKQQTYVLLPMIFRGAHHVNRPEVSDESIEGL